MNDLRIRPKGDYNENASWENLYRLTKEWNKLADFCEDELKFLSNLLSKYFAKIIEDGDFADAKEKVIRTEALMFSLNDLRDKIYNHSLQLEYILKNKNGLQHSVIRKDQEVLEEDVFSFGIRFQNFKREVFEMVELVLHSEKLRRLLDQ